MLLPHALYVTIFLLLCAIVAGFLVFVLLKAIPRRNSTTSESLRGCAGIFGFMIMFSACMLGLAMVMPSSTIVFAGPDKEYSRKTAILFKPSSLIEQYGISDFEFGKNYIINTTGRNMMIYSVTYSNMPVFFDQTKPLVEVPAEKCTWIKPGYMPDFYFEEPEAIEVERDEDKVQHRLILDYTPINP